MLPKRLFAIVTVAMLLFATHECNALVVDGNRIMDQDMGENLCALTFDDGPSNFTPHLLDMLRDYGIPPHSSCSAAMPAACLALCAALPRKAMKLATIHSVIPICTT